MRLKIAIVQINSLLGHPQQNITKIHNLLSTIKGKFPDLVVLSELAITGYNFSSAKHIQPFLESPLKYGASLKFAHELSQKHHCFTVVGYPEGVSIGEVNGGGSRDEQLIYNSCAVFNRGGDLIYNYRKTFLYETDEKWGCLENPDAKFTPIPLQFSANEERGGDDTSVLANFGICMDLNPYKFEAPFNKFEFSAQSYHNRAKLIICPMAWLSPQSPSIKLELNEQEKLKQAESLHLSSQPCDETINYWILRFFPFLKHKYSFMPKWWSADEKVNVLICNRVGREGDVVYGGSSCILQFNNNKEEVTSGGDDGDGFDAIDESNPSVDVVGRLSQSEEGILVQEIDV
ncbi:NTA1 [Candida margitis]|uniref:NTA1 n=1 Tax=Candida margitis TaxID=1775924 RepID=UPI0022262448|nr:NTA1 [Candida margitis]KAI5953976.1 NTA1 [Candida margitis]